jgi:hypothetical protein
MASEHQMLKSYLKAAARGCLEPQEDIRETAMSALIAIERLEARLEQLERMYSEHCNGND